MTQLAGAVLLSTAAACGQNAALPHAPEPAASTAEEGDLGVPPAQAESEPKDPEARRVKLIVVPGDATVEVNGVPRARRDGVIELLGREGSRPHVRVSRGSQYGEKDVSILATGASPPLLNLSELAQAMPSARSVFTDPTLQAALAAERPRAANVAKPALAELIVRMEKANACACPLPQEAPFRGWKVKEVVEPQQAARPGAPAPGGRRHKDSPAGDKGSSPGVTWTFPL